MNNESSIEQHTPVKSIALHLIPGVLIAAVYFLLTPLLSRWGYPSIMALMCTVLLVLMPLEIGILLHYGKKLNGRLSLRGVVMYRGKISIWQYLLWVPILFLILGLIFTAMKPVDAFLQHNLFGWIPALQSGLQAEYTREVLIITYLMVALFGMILGPLTEEFYFRGFLLPRMGYAGRWAPFLHSFLFALYHFWTPWMIVTRTLGMIPLVYAVQKRNLYVSIIVHFLVNAVDVVTGFVFIAALSKVV